jgi:hypothetical protein
MKRILATLCLFTLSAPVVSFAGIAEGQTTHNLDIIWHCPKPDTFPWGAWGYAIAAGDFNNDSFIDIVSSLRISQNLPINWKKYFYSSNPLDTIPDIVISDYIGSSSPNAMCSGDFNGDGITDLAISDPVGRDTLGRVDIFYGRTGFDLQPDTCIRGPVSVKGCEFGRALASGDVNGDGISDVIAGAYWGNRVFIYYGDTLGIHTVPDVTLKSLYSENYGLTVTSGGDMDGDGFDEVAVGAPYNYELYSAGGKVYIYRGGISMDTLPYAWMFGENSGANLGILPIAVVPNPNGVYATGFWGTPFSPSYPSPGKQYWLYGGSGFDGIPDLTAQGDFDSSGLGCCSAYAGDVDGNGYGDFISGAPYERYRGGAYVWLGSGSMSNIYAGYIRGIERDLLNGMYMRMGGTVTGVGDIDKDGKDEFAVSNYSGDTLRAIWICKYTGPGAGAQGPFEGLDVGRLKLFPNVPNPFGRSTAIRYQLKTNDHVSLRIYNIAGQHVAGLVNENRQQGVHEARWNGKNSLGNNCSPGVYICKLETGGSSTMRKMLLIK